MQNNGTNRKCESRGGIATFWAAALSLVFAFSGSRTIQAAGLKLCRVARIAPRLAAAAALGLAALSAGPARAQTINFISASTSAALIFNTPTTLTKQVNLFSTEITGKLNGVVVYDQTFKAAFADPVVQAGVAAANAAILAKGGPGVMTGAPRLILSTPSTSSTSTSIYSLAGSTVTFQSPEFYFGPVTFFYGVRSSCAVGGLPSSTQPSCTSPGGTPGTLLAGQTDTNVDTHTVYTIATATTTTNTTTLSEVYEIDGTTPCGSGDAALVNKKFPPGQMTYDVSSPTRTLQSITLTSSSNIGSFTLPSVVSGGHSATGGVFTKTNTAKSATFELAATFVSPAFACSIDPLTTTLKINTGHKVVQAFQKIPGSEHFIEIDNGNPGLRWLRIEVNGKYGGTLSLISGRTVHVDLSEAMNLGQNTLTFTGEGQTGTFATIEVSDSAPPKTPATNTPSSASAQETGIWGHLMFEKEVP
ncbi:MAG: hypothetical protein ACREC0_06695 [Methylocella sp.]